MLSIRHLAGSTTARSAVRSVPLSLKTWSSLVRDSALKSNAALCPQRQHVLLHRATPLRMTFSSLHPKYSLGGMRSRSFTTEVNEIPSLEPNRAFLPYQTSPQQTTVYSVPSHTFKPASVAPSEKDIEYIPSPPFPLGKEGSGCLRAEMELTFLGTASSKPTRERNVTSIALRRDSVCL